MALAAQLSAMGGKEESGSKGSSEAGDEDDDDDDFIQGPDGTVLASGAPLPL